MSIRLNKNEAEIAARELIDILRQNLQGMRTSDLSGTPMFHGPRTLSNRVIIRLLRSSAEFQSGELTESVGGQGMYTYSWWRLSPRKTSQVSPTLADQHAAK